MTRPKPISGRTVIQWVAAIVTIVVAGYGIGWLHDHDPRLEQDFIVPAAEDPQDPASTIVTCERTLPGASTVPRGQSAPTVVGRVTSTEVLECPDSFDGATVVYIGEVIGDVLQRDGGAWVLMNDDAYALEDGPVRATGVYHGYNSGLSVWLPEDAVDLVEHPGGPGWRGDVLRVRGTVHRVDPADGGGLTIRAEQARLLAEAKPLDLAVDRTQMIVALVLLVLAVGAVVYERTVAAGR